MSRPKITTIETEDADDIVCPYCGTHDYDYGDIFPKGNDEADTDCGVCGKEFHVSREWYVTYTTTVIQGDEK